MTDTAQLIARLEEATEGSEELDWEILRQFGNPTRNIHTCPDHMWRCIRMGEYRPIEFSTSIDAALTLVPEGYSKHINEGAHIGGASAWCCPGGGDSRGVSDPRTGATDRPAPTMALALCIAALRARSSNVER